ncbi:MAG: transglutaminase domain-containing protein, partial [Firmicutes bacterium]|nr:transglutaminase domain-containing protein [Bacillota bacterium]
AVCDGICKAFLIMARIENIACVRVVGNSHAWNKVYVDGNWFGVDATHGNLAVSEKEVLTYTNFLFTDDYKEKSGYTATNYTNLIANTNFNIYEYISFGLAGNEFDLLINNQLEFEKVVLLVKTYSSVSDVYTFEIALAKDYNVSISTLFSVARSNGLNIDNTYVERNESSGLKTYIIYVKK